MKQHAKSAARGAGGLMGVLLQGFYWDCHWDTDRVGSWWPFLRPHVSELADVGFSALWLPPCHKGMAGQGMGYDPFDYYDFGELDQNGSIATGFGTRAELVALIDACHARGLQVYADVVYNHCSGGEKELNPLTEREAWTLFRPRSNKFARDHSCFHPSRYESWDDGNFSGMPDLCHRSPVVFKEVLDHARYLIEELSFDGFRYDLVKGYGGWMVRAIQEFLYLRRGADGTRTWYRPFGVGEAWAGDREIGDWLEEANRWSDNPVKAFDFPLRYRLKDLCDRPGYSLRELVAPGTLMADRPHDAVTFVDNHDFRGGDSAEIVHDKLLAYAFILTHEGYPCVFWKDYFRYELGLAGEPSGIAALVRAHEDYAGGSTTVRWLSDDLYIMERSGHGTQPGLILVLNNRGDTWQGAWVDTFRADRSYEPIAWRGRGDTNRPLPSRSAADGRAQFWAPPRGYTVYVPR